MSFIKKDYESSPIRQPRGRPRKYPRKTPNVSPYPYSVSRSAVQLEPISQSYQCPASSNKITREYISLLSSDSESDSEAKHKSTILKNEHYHTASNQPNYPNIPNTTQAQPLPVSTHISPNIAPSPAVRTDQSIIANGYNLNQLSPTVIAFRQKLRRLPGPPVTIANDVDHSPPPDFTFITDYVFRNGHSRPDTAFVTGCTCRKDNGRNVGCEYTSCECLEDVGVDKYGKSLGYPYNAINQKQGCLRPKWLETRSVIYECNDKCNCPPHCKNKVVQKGRQIRLEIFRTKNRGWGLRSPDFIPQGRFIDTYIGEIISDEEATRREQGVVGKDSYLFALDKFQGEEGDPDYIPDSELYIVDGQFMGGPSRFINHSCEPNCVQYVVSLMRGDPKLFELAFFARQDIPAGTELTFDYLDKDQGADEDDDADEMEVDDGNVQDVEKTKGRTATKCLCGAGNCRKWLWL